MLYAAIVVTCIGVSIMGMPIALAIYSKNRTRKNNQEKLYNDLMQELKESIDIPISSKEGQKLHKELEYI